MSASSTKTIRCRKCELLQYPRIDGRCPRCGTSTSFLVTVPLPGTPKININVSPPQESGEVLPMRQVMRAAAVHALQLTGKTMKAAAALRIPHGRLKQLLREAGYERDHRYKRGEDHGQPGADLASASAQDGIGSCPTPD